MSTDLTCDSMGVERERKKEREKREKRERKREREKEKERGKERAHVDSIWDVGVHYVLVDIVGAEHPDGLRCGILQEHISERMHEKIVDVPVPETRTFPQERISERTQITVPVSFQEDTDEVIKLFPALYPTERISQRAAEQIVDMPVPQIQEQIVEVAKTIPQERISKRIVVQTEDVSVPQILKEVVEVVKAVKTVPQDRIAETICEQIVDTPVSQAVYELVPSFPSFQEEIDEMIKLFPEERVPKRISRSRSASRSVYTNRPSINQVTKHAEIPQIPYIDKVVDMPVVMQCQVPRIQTVLKIMEVPINQATKHAEFPQTLYIDKVVELPVVLQR